MSLRIDQFQDVEGRYLRGFFVRNRKDKILAVGGEGFVIPSRKRYARDIDLCRALGKLTGQPVKWPLFFYCGMVSSHGSERAKQLWNALSPNYQRSLQNAGRPR